MKINYLITLFLLSGIYLCFIIPLSNQVLNHCNDYQKKVNDQVKILDVESRLISGEEWAYALSNEQNNETIDFAMKTIKEARISYNKAIRTAYNILWASLLFVLLIIVLNYNGTNLFKALIACTAVIGLIALYIGVYAPILEIHAYSRNLEIPLVLKLKDILTLADLSLEDLSNWINNDFNNNIQSYLKDFSLFGLKIPDLNLDLNLNLASYFNEKDYSIDLTAKFYGDIYYYYQSKSAMSLIGSLFTQKNYVVGIALLTFSVIIPIIKLLMTVLITFFKSFSKKIGLITIINFIGKWSMADVFVAACFLSFLSFNNMSNQIETESKTLIGLYFFLSYVVISLIASTLMNLQLKKMD
ncbi:MAG: hypothetical protein CL846_10170 [Crocinitomicaceae bacterium]|nr:hypothetical protein [Crocinitomicaceae bacterium]|tara:strand:- start:1882 stop:2952 length:1071 start_codon:yes stop_codon:yes gene_type:complete